MRRLASLLIVLAAAVGAAPHAHADPVGYVINVTVRPGFGFGNADAALAYGYGICEQVHKGVAYSQNIAAVKRDLDTNDDYQATYLINQAVNELCPALIWHLRQSAAQKFPASGGQE